jgi:poly(A) polymerase
MMFHTDSFTLSLLQQINQHFNDIHKQAFLVGGSVRDLLMGHAHTDWDIVTDGDVPRIARRVANKLVGFYAHLNEKADRVIVKHEGQDVTFDFSHLAADSIEENLQARDFTINAIAAPLSSVVEHLSNGSPLICIDPSGGVADIAARRLRVVKDDAFKRDPLRLLRAVRFMTRYQLTIEGNSEYALTRDAPLLTQAAAERIHAELYAILQAEGATAHLRFLDEHELFMTLFPEFIPARGMPQPGLHHWDVLEHSLETVGALERLATLLQQPAEDIQGLLPGGEDRNDLVTLQALLREGEQQGLLQFSTLTSPVMKLAALLHDIGKPPTYTVSEAGEIRFYHHPQAGVPLAQQIMKRLSASTRDCRLVQQVVAHHMRTGQLSREQITERAIRRYFVDLGPTGIYVGLVSLADHLAMRGPQLLTVSWARHLATVRLLFTRYIRQRERILPPHIIEPQELIRRLGIAPGPQVGQLLEAIAEAQAEGEVHSKEDALWIAHQRLDKL